MKSLIFALTLALPLAANAEIAGVYSCSGTIRSIVKANGRSTRVNSYSTVQLTLNPDGTAISINPISPYPSHGSWRQNGSKIILGFDQNDIRTNAEYGCQIAGGSCTYLGSTYNYWLIPNKAQTVLKGTWKMNMSMLTRGMLVNNNATMRVTCGK